MRGKTILGALIATVILAGCGANAEMAHQRESAGIPGCSALPSGPGKTGSATATEGQPMPDRDLPCLGDEATVSVAQATSKGVTVVTIWASWCRPCRSEAPLIADAYRRYHDRVQFLGVDYAEPDASEAISFAGDTGLIFPHLQDPDGTIRGAWQISGVPVSFIVKNGIIVTRHSGQWRSQQELNSAIDKAIERTS